VDAPHAMTLGDVAREHRRTYRSKTAAVCEGDRFTYEQLDDRVNRLTGALLDAGVADGQRVLWLGQNCHRVLELLLACAKSGAMFCPANWRMTADEMAFVIEDLDPAIVVWQDADMGERVAAARHAGEKALWLQHDARGKGSYETFLDAGAAADPDRVVDPAASVLIMYTAAFGGRPNGSMLSHTNLLTQSVVLRHLSDIWNDYVYLNCGPLFHMATFMYTITTLHAGGTNVFTRRADAEDICRLVDAERCTGGFVLGPTIDQIVELNAEGRYDLSSLRTVIPIPGWSEMTSRDTSPFATRPGAYGQTEVSGIAVYAAYGGHPGVFTAGRPGPGTRIRIVDPDDREVPDGETGEIVVAGPIVHNGYWHRPELNGERFRGGWWHTNDLGRRDPDGVLTFIGPKAHLIKSGVENIYPVEVERCIEEHPDVREAAVIGVPDRKWTQTVKAIVVREGDAALTAEDVIEHCRARIASYKKPTSVEFLNEALPRTAAGAKDHAALDDRFGGGNYPGTGTRSV